MRIGASFDPNAEICDNGEDDRDNDGLIDCDDDECKDSMACREEKENHGYSYYRGGGRERVYPTYRRDYLKQDKAPMKKILRYVSPVIIKWHL